MSSCAIFGHSDYYYEGNRVKIEKGLCGLIEDNGATDFFVGARGNFDLLCIEILRGLKREYPHIKIIRVWSYIPQEKQKEEIDALNRKRSEEEREDAIKTMLISALCGALAAAFPTIFYIVKLILV